MTPPEGQDGAMDTHGLLATLIERTGAMKADLAALREDLKRGYVSIDRFVPIERAVYGLVGVVGTSVILALLYAVMRHPV